MRATPRRCGFIAVALSLLTCVASARGQAAGVALNGRALGPVCMDAQIAVRGAMAQRIDADPGSPLKLAQLHLGESVWGQNHLRLVVCRLSAEAQNVPVMARVTVADAGGKELYSAETRIERFLPCKAAEGQALPTPPNPFAEIEALGVRQHWDWALTEKDFQTYLPYRFEVTDLPATVTVRVREARAAGREWGSVSRAVPAFGYVRLHAARCNPFVDTKSVPAFLRVWLEPGLLAKAAVDLKLVDEKSGKALREERLTGFSARDLGFDLNLDGLGAGRYRVEARLSGPGIPKDLSCVWIEKRALPDAAALRVPIVVSEAPGLSRKDGTATGGVPVADGMLAASAVGSCRVLDAQGRAIPAQVRPLAFWAEDKRFVRWLLVGIQTSSEKGRCGPYALVMGKDAPPATPTPVRVTETATGFRVETGTLTAVFNARGGRFLEQLLAGGQDVLRDKGALEAYMNLVPQVDGTAAVALTTANSPDLTSVVEESGALRTVVRVRGSYGDPAGRGMNECILRFTFHAGSADVEVEHTFVWKGDPKPYAIKGFGIRLPLGGLSAAMAPAEVGGEPVQSPLPWTVRQDDDKSYVLGAGKRPGRWPGWAGAVGKPVSAAVFMRDFWQQCPAGMRVDEAGFELQFQPAESAPLALHAPKDKYAYFGASETGVAKTHRAVIAFRAQPLADRELAAWAQCAAEPMLLAAEPAAVLTSNALWRLHPYDPKNFADDEKALENVFLGIERQPIDTGVFGCMDWGDLHSKWDPQKKEWSDYRYWLNNETTGDCTTISTWMQYARTADRRYFPFNERRTSHLMDVDMCHFSANQPPHFDGVYPADNVNIVGIQHRHAGRHISGSTCPHHTTYDDIVMYYLLTGRARALDVLSEAAGSMLGYAPRGHFQSQQDYRQHSVPFRLMGDLYWQFWNYDHWRMAAELHDRLMTYSFPDGRGEYGYVRHALFTGDRRYAAEWLTRRLVRGDELKAALDPANLDDAARESSFYDSVMMNALKYEITGDRAPLARTLEAVKRGGKISYVVAAPLLKNYPDDGAKANPPGYGWPMMAAFKYAYGMDALLRSGLLEERKLGPAARTNGKGGGRWSDAATFADGRRPDAGCELIVQEGDALVYDGDMSEAGLGGLTVAKGARLTFAAGKHRLVIRGNAGIQKGALLKLGPGSALLLDSDLYGRQYGITMEGRLEAEGTSPQQRDCRLGSLRQDGAHGITMFFDGRQANPKESYGFIRNSDFGECETTLSRGGIEVTGSLLTRCSVDAKWMYDCPLTFTGNELVGCLVKTYDIRNWTFEKNVVRGGRVFLHPHQPQGRMRFTDNVIERGENRTVWVISLPEDNVFSGNVYRDCAGTAFYIQNSAVPVVLRGERFAGNVTAVESEAPVTVSMEKCVFGTDAPNAKADVAAGPARVWMKSCVFEREPKIATADDGGVRSDEHNGRAGVTKSWGKPLKEADFPAKLSH